MARYDLIPNLAQKQYTRNLIYICSSGVSATEVYWNEMILTFCFVNYCGFAVPFLPIKLLWICGITPGKYRNWVTTNSTICVQDASLRHSRLGRHPLVHRRASAALRGRPSPTKEYTQGMNRCATYHHQQS